MLLNGVPEGHAEAGMARSDAGFSPLMETQSEVLHAMTSHLIAVRGSPKFIFISYMHVR